MHEDIDDGADRVRGWTMWESEDMAGICARG
jgi:hypothetical protein